MTTLADFFAGLADAVRAKDGTTDKIPALELPKRIGSITTLPEGTADATATAEFITEGKTAYVGGQKVIGTYQHPTHFLVNGVSIPIVEVDSTGVVPEATATTDDICIGKTAMTNQGYITGEYKHPTSLVVNGLSIPIVEVNDTTGVAPELTATPNDIRLGETAVTNQGVTTGEKDIPSYRTTAGAIVVPANAAFELPLNNYDMYDYTKLQAMIVPYNTSMANSVAVDKVVIEDKVYQAGQTTILSTVTKDFANKKISFGVTNGSTPAVIRYFVIKEEE